MKIRLQGYVISNVGLKKTANEDNYLINNFINDTYEPTKEEGLDLSVKRKEACFAAVFDGMGGGECGQLAAYFAADTFREIIGKTPSAMVEYEIDNLAKQAFLATNGKIVEERKTHSVLGTTATLLCVHDNKIKLFHIGDSRAYICKDGRLIRLTKDQTLATLKIEAGIYSADDPQVLTDQNLLTEYLGADETLTSISPIESKWVPINKGDTIMLCSDGLYHFCDDTIIGEVLNSDKEPDRKADRLVRKALQNGGIDNITCMVISVRD